MSQCGSPDSLWESRSWHHIGSPWKAQHLEASLKLILEEEATVWLNICVWHSIGVNLTF